MVKLGLRKMDYSWKNIFLFFIHIFRVKVGMAISVLTGVKCIMVNLGLRNNQIMVFSYILIYHKL